MCGGSRAPAPVLPPVVPEAPVAPEALSGDAAADRDKRRRAAASGTSGGRSTVLTGARGVTTNAPVATKTLLGS